MSSQKGLVQRIERKLEVSVGNAFARVFGGSIVPEEIDALLRREAADGVRSLQGNRLLAPNEYILTLSVHDFEKLGADPDLTSSAFARYLADHIHEQGWQTYGDVVVRFEQSSNLHTGQFRARGAVNPDVEPRPTVIDPGPPQSEDAFGAEPGVPPMTDNPGYRGGQGQGRPDEYYEDRYARPQDDPQAAPDPRGGYPPEQAGYPPQQGYPPRQEQGGYPPQGGYPGGYPEQGGYPGQAGYPAQGGYPGGYPEQGGYPPSYEQRPPSPSGPAPTYSAPPPQAPPAGAGYEQGYPQQGGYGQQPGYGGYADYGRGPARQDEAAYPPPAAPEPQRPGYPEQGGYEQGYPQGGYAQPGQPGQQEYSAGDYTQYAAAPAAGEYAPPGGGGYGEPAGRDYEYGGAPGQPAGGYGGYAPGGYGAGATAVTLQLDDGSGRTYQLRDGSNIIGRGQDAQFRLPDTGVSRRHLEIRWDGQVALLSDLNSTNGTTVNNSPVQEWQLADGDVIRLGHSEIIVRIH